MSDQKVTETPGTVGTPSGNEEVVDTSTPAPTLKDMVNWEVKRLATISRGIQENIKGAKTSTKKEYFLKKIRKNNKKLADMIMRLEQLNKQGDTSGH